jgi:hypothetical protein
MLRRIFESKEEEGTGIWRKLHGMYSSPSVVLVNNIRRMK